MTVGKITEVPDHATCKFDPMYEYDGLIGRLLIKLHKGNTYSRYVFNLSRFIEEAKVIEILPDEYQAITFRGYDNVFLTYPRLQLVMTSEKFKDYKSALKSVKGVYVLTDTKTGKLYIGSAYGEYGLAQRWDCYLNKKLAEIKSS